MDSTLKIGEKSRDKISLIVVSTAGVVRGGLGLLIEHPFDTLKTWMQSSNQTPKQGLA